MYDWFNIKIYLKSEVEVMSRFCQGVECQGLSMFAKAYSFYDVGPMSMFIGVSRNSQGLSRICQGLSRGGAGRAGVYV